MDKNGQKWTKMDKNGQKWTKMDKKLIPKTFNKIVAKKSRFVEV
jgi:hypothetical protein